MSTLITYRREIGQDFGFTQFESAAATQVYAACSREAQRLVLEGATPARVDNIFRALGMHTGILAMLDRIGLDMRWPAYAACHARIVQDPSYWRLADELEAMGYLGCKNGRGFYRYQDRERLEDYEVVAIAELLAAELQIFRRPISEREIYDRALFTLLNVGIHLLDEGTQQEASSLTSTWLSTGNALTHPAEHSGLNAILDGLQRYRKRLGEYGDTWFRPAPLLEHLAASHNQSDAK
ncbi:3-hydroxyacyl-CoA dehydrogenase family protein [Aquipseudomonas ullengensis]|uniref:3-hydroxyacyl-CoA dehydrogenase C-terminal domain-containing protein n=1 Tax=Aquipseudomonas ullengensis TaxID=2759166 RepID=A0A7W4LPU7_9GAMM|nr:3-hydroxyacyl-CoA dehydrogenase family protein [Pseudomonas ullengensis]MBB2497082.1 hypothetical protein [Pseudomonas ullengensis]